jgi:outer membrane protein TolC
MLVIALAAGAFAAPLTLDDVLYRVDTRVPELGAAEAKLDGAGAAMRGARGSFDPKFSAYGSAYRGPYPRDIVDLSVSGETSVGPAWGAGWRQGTGVFPSYAEVDLTSPDGELYARVEVPLLDGLLAGDGAANLRVAAAGLSGAEASYAAKWVTLRLKATEAYWKWVATGAKLAVEEEQLALATRRLQALEREVALGSRPTIDVIDNERVLLDRQGKVALARAEVTAAAHALSRLYRDDDGAPVVPTRDALPGEWAPPPPPPAMELDLAAALGRPELAVIEADRVAAEASLARARNGLLPTVDATAEVSSPPLGGKTEVIAGVKVELSATGRKARAERDKAAANLTAIEQTARAVRDQIAAALHATHARWEATAERAQLAAEVSLRAEELVVATERRFELGGADLFDLLLREKGLADARRAHVDAELALRLVEAERAALTATLSPPAR